MYKMKIIQIGTSVGIVLSKEMLSKLHAEKGDEVFFIETSDGFKLVTYDPEFERQMKIAEKLRKKNKNSLNLLAKS